MSQTKKTRITVDLGNPVLLKLLKSEAIEKETSVRDVVVTALDGYFAHKLEMQVIAKASESVFEEWADDRDSEYDSL